MANERPLWYNKDGVGISIDSMTDEHLLNSMKFLRRKAQLACIQTMKHPAAWLGSVPPIFWDLFGEFLHRIKNTAQAILYVNQGEIEKLLYVHDKNKNGDKNGD